MPNREKDVPAGVHLCVFLNERLLIRSDHLPFIWSSQLLYVRLMKVMKRRTDSTPSHPQTSRVCPGKCYHLYNGLRASLLDAYQLPEIMRTPLEELCLQIKVVHTEIAWDQRVEDTMKMRPLIWMSEHGGQTLQPFFSLALNRPFFLILPSWLLQDLLGLDMSLSIFLQTITTVHRLTLALPVFFHLHPLTIFPYSPL